MFATVVILLPRKSALLCRKMNQTFHISPVLDQNSSTGPDGGVTETVPGLKFIKQNQPDALSLCTFNQNAALLEMLLEMLRDAQGCGNYEVHYFVFPQKLYI